MRSRRLIVAAVLAAIVALAAGGVLLGTGSLPTGRAQAQSEAEHQEAVSEALNSPEALQAQIMAERVRNDELEKQIAEIAVLIEDADDLYHQVKPCGEQPAYSRCQIANKVALTAQFAWSLTDVSEFWRCAKEPGVRSCAVAFLAILDSGEGQLVVEALDRLVPALKTGKRSQIAVSAKRAEGALREERDELVREQPGLARRAGEAARMATALALLERSS